VNFVPVALGFSSTQVNVLGRSLFTHKGWQFIGFYDPKSYLVLGKRMLNSTEWQLEKSQYKGKITDSH
jgi:hypothetical protein